MGSIFFVNGLKRIKDLAGSGETFQYLILNSASDMTSYLKSHACFYSVDHQRLSAELNNDFVKKYIEFIAQLNNDHQSLLWWALNLTGKSTFSTRLCERLFNFCLIIKTYYESSHSVIVVSDDPVLLRQIRTWGKKKDIKVCCRVRNKLSFTKIAKEIVPVSVIYVFCRTLLYKFYAWRYCNFKINRNCEYVVLKTILSRQSFDQEGIFFDTYFGELVNYLNRGNIPYILFTTVFPPYDVNLRKALRQHNRIKIVPIEKYLSLVSIVKCFIKALSKYFLPFRLNGKTDLEGFDVGYLVREAIRQDCISTKFFTNLLMYYCTASLAQKIRIKKVFYPFENRSWEKMLILALRKCCPTLSIIGYQHSFITPKHVEMYLGRKEDIPLPDRIITNGEITRDILERVCNFSAGMLKTGCALRQNNIVPVFKNNKKMSDFSNVLVIMSVSIEYYLEMIAFLNEAFSGNTFYNIALRPHPEILLSGSLQKLAVFKFSLSDKESLDDALNWADIVVYHSSAVAIRALSLGMPVIYLKIDDFLDPDPLFDFNCLKWSAIKPQELIESLKYINTMNESEFKSLKSKAIEYAEKYFYAVTDNNLKEFLICAGK